ncbi:MAG: helix-turn-helix domain-containing protein [Ruminococcaceae bacterium]|nr:helix-turn-helix domain-containing protein [Oscillospiraceae bacterium]
MVANKLKELRHKAGLTLEELAEKLGTSKQTIHRYENGVIANIPHEKIKRLAEALGASPSELMGWEKSISEYDNLLPIKKKNLPLVGTIACGEPIYASEEYGSFVTINSDIDASFCLRAKGDSMIGARIYDGDLVFIREQYTVDNGEIAAVIINDEATLKRVYYYPEEAKIILTPENPKYAPLVYINEELNSIKILGKAVAFQSIIR